MPLSISVNLPTILILKPAFEARGLTRSELDTRFNLTDQEFQIENDLISVGPLPGDDMLPDLIAFLEERGLNFFDDFFELSGNWPDWLGIYARANPR